MKFLAIHIILSIFASCSFSAVAAVPQLSNRDIVSMADGVVYARNFMDARYAKVKRDCGYPADANGDGDIDNPKDCDNDPALHCKACNDACGNYGTEPCINGACGIGQVGCYAGCASLDVC